MSTWSDSDPRSAADEVPTRPGTFPGLRHVVDLRELSQGTGPLKEVELAALRSLVAGDRGSDCGPVWRPSAACVILGAAIWALAFVGLWSLVMG